MGRTIIKYGFWFSVVVFILLPLLLLGGAYAYYQIDLGGYRRNIKDPMFQYITQKKREELIAANAMYGSEEYVYPGENPSDSDPDCMMILFHAYEGFWPSINSVQIYFHQCSSVKGNETARYRKVAKCIRDISPLSGLPLKMLHMQHTKVSDLTPLAGMPLENLLLPTDIEGPNKLIDLSPLEGMKLRRIDLYKCKVTDLSPLKGMTLAIFEVIQTPITDIKVLKGMPLGHVNLFDVPVRDLSPLTGAKLQYLDCRSSLIDTLPSFSGMPIQYINLKKTKIKDLSEMSGITADKLTIDLSDTEVSDLSPLAKIKVKELTLNLSGTKVTDLSPLKGLPIRDLNIAHTAVTDVAPLQKISTLRNLWMQFTPVKNLDALLDTEMHIYVAYGSNGGSLGGRVKSIMASHQQGDDFIWTKKDK